MNYMIHNLTPNETSVYITYDIDFVPLSEPAAAGITTAKPLWMDVAGIRPYPVFDVKQGTGNNGKFTFPAQAAGAERAKIGRAQKSRVRQDMTLLNTAGHLHPGGLYTDLNATRDGRRINLFRSEAEYYEPAGAVSWDVAMTGTRPDWRPVLRAGDRLSISATYDSARASWYESMGIMVVFYADGARPEGTDPFAQGINARGTVTHGHLAENDSHGGLESILPNARELLGTPAGGKAINIKGFLYGKGDLVRGDTSIPTVRRGRSLTFKNLDDSKTIWHTITECRRPCDREAGIAYPLANGKADFDSGELGTDPARRGFTASSGKVSWKTPKNLSPGTYTYFCRIHPFMRGAFRVINDTA
jgi:plastocyanin